MEKKPHIFHITISWKEKNNTYSRDFIITTENKKQAETIAKNHIPLQIIQNLQTSEDLNIRTRDFGIPQNGRNYYSSLIYKTDGLKNDTEIVKQQLQTVFAMLWGGQTINQSIMEKLKNINNITDLTYLFQKWSDEYISTTDINLEDFFKEKINNLLIPDTQIETIQNLYITNRYDPIKAAQQEAEKIIQTATEHANSILQNIEPLLKYYSEQEKSEEINNHSDENNKNTNQTIDDDNYFQDIPTKTLIEWTKKTISIIQSVPTNGYVLFEKLSESLNEKDKRKLLLKMMKETLRMPIEGESAWEYFKNKQKKE